MSSNPKVFVSHASEDKERFVTDFATKLREKGVDAWLDNWEIGPGDSLVDKIYEEGIKQAQAIIVVLSPTSVTKPWVREELNASFVKRINHGSKLIPVVIEDCNIPESLKSTLYQRIGDLISYDQELDKIVDAIYGHSNKPPIGDPPRYVADTYTVIPGLNNTDIAIIKILGDQIVSTNSNHWTNKFEFDKRGKVLDLNSQVIEDSLSIIANNGLISSSHGHGKLIWNFQLSDFGFENYLKAYYQGYSDLIRNIALQIVNEDKSQSEEIATALGCPSILVVHVFEIFKDRGFLSIKSILDGTHNSSVDNITPSLKRWIESSEPL